MGAKRKPDAAFSKVSDNALEDLLNSSGLAAGKKKEGGGGGGAFSRPKPAPVKVSPSPYQPPPSLIPFLPPCFGSPPSASTTDQQTQISLLADHMPPSCLCTAHFDTASTNFLFSDE